MNSQKIRLYRLHKQNLIQPAPGSATQQLLDQHLALHATDNLTPYFSLWARIQNFDPSSFFQQLNQVQDIVKARAFRGTIFVMSVENYFYVRAALNQILASQFKEFQKRIVRLESNWEKRTAEILQLFSGQRSLTVTQIKKHLSADLNGELRQLIFSYLEFTGTLVRTGQRYLIDPVNQYGLAEEWIPRLRLIKYEPELALAEIMNKYIRLFGPVSLEDLCWWFPLSKALARKILDLIKNEIIAEEANENEYFWEKSDYDQFLAFEPPPANVPIINFLPYEDHFPKAYKIRDWYISAASTPRLFNVGKIDWGQLRPSIWLNGEIIGRWELEFTDNSKSELKIKVLNLNEGLTSDQPIKQLIAARQEELQKFSNEKLLPLMRKK